MDRSDFTTLATLARTANPYDAGQTRSLVDRVRALRDRTVGAEDASGLFDAAALLARHTVALPGESAEAVREVVGRLLDSALAHAPVSGAPDQVRRSVVLKQADPGELTHTDLRLVSDLYLGELLVRDGVVTQALLDRALAEQRVTGGRIGETLVAMGVTTWDEINAALRVQGKPPGRTARGA